jgi:hypothetical protein
LSVDAVHASPTWEDVTLVAVGVPGVVGGEVSGSVVADAGVLGGDTFADASEAVTV